MRPEAFAQSGEAVVPDAWWTSFGDPALSDLVEQALEENFTLEATWQRFQAAQARRRVADAARWPELDGTVSVGRTARKDAEDTDTWELGLGARYEVDLWGRIRSAREASRLDAAASLADYQTAALSLTAEIASVWFQLNEAELQGALLEEQAETNETILSLLKRRFASGQISSADVLRQQQLIEATREQLAINSGLRATLRTQLAVLIGQPPREPEFNAASWQLPTLPPLPRTGIPADLLQRRPDLRAAWFDLQAADATLAEAVAAQYPRINLSADLRTVAENPEDLFSDWIASLFADLTAPLLDGGRRRAEVEVQLAERRVQLATYEQTVLTAFQEVEDALARESSQDRRIQRLERQLDLAQETYRQLRLQYLNGVEDYLSVLSALIDTQQLERDLLVARRALAEIRLELYRALAGSPPTPREPEDLSVAQPSNLPRRS